MTNSKSSLTEWLARLETFSPHEIDLGLDRVATVLERLSPRYPETIFTIGGTNGKGSSVTMAAALLRLTGATVGTYTSPHVLHYNERIAINGESVADATLVDAFERIDAARGDVPLTYFEFGTIAAIMVFADFDVQCAVLEVGMGGRLDAVNAIEPSACLITNVSLDHCAWLGNDVETIAVEKAGILRGDKPAVFAALDMPASIGRIAKERGVDLRQAGRDYRWQTATDSWAFEGRALSLLGLLPPALAGPMQITNAAGVLALLEAAGYAGHLDTASVNRAFASLHLPGRMQAFRDEQNWLLDVAHNPAAAAALAATLGEMNFAGRTVAMLAMLDDKDVESTIAPLVPLVDDWIAFPADSHRATAVDELARRVANTSNRACFEAASTADAMAEARRLCGPADRILVTGSFYGVGPVIEALGLYSPR